MLSAPRFTLKQLAYFAAAADEGTITGAAELLHISPSAMSDAITELESIMGEELCVRRRAHGLTLTPAGRLLLSHARHILSESDELARALGDSTGSSAGPIVIGCYPTLAPMILPTLLQDFGALHPNVELSILEATQDRLASALGSGQVDIAFVYDMLVPGNPHRSELFNLLAHVVLPADHPLAVQPTVNLEQLVDDDLILLDAQPSSEHTLGLFAERGLRPRVRHRTSSYEVVRTLVARGLGYGVLVAPVANPLSYEGRPLVAKPIEPAVRPVCVEVIWPHDRPMTKRAEALLDFARGVNWLA